ncbi:hypothetical protein P886_3214 [Alteromonadaceae bacterium 2753L.S.0a.02]|nr:hypothetical protein P886_3214 [Alteromonadaceae bacterium 2753L.S.0a.02]
MNSTNVVAFRDERAFFSPTTPAHLQLVLDEALAAGDFAKREETLLTARSRWPDEPDTHISLYKFYFVAAEYAKAEAAVWGALKRAAELAGFNRNYRRLTPESADWSKRSGAERLYLFSLKALGVCRLRRGRVLAAHSVLNKLCELDVSDEIGGHSYFSIAASFFETEED